MPEGRLAVLDAAMWLRQASTPGRRSSSVRAWLRQRARPVLLLLGQHERRCVRAGSAAGPGLGIKGVASVRGQTAGGGSIARNPRGRLRSTRPPGGLNLIGGQQQSQADQTKDHLFGRAGVCSADPDNHQTDHRHGDHAQKCKTEDPGHASGYARLSGPATVAAPSLNGHVRASRRSNHFRNPGGHLGQPTREDSRSPQPDPEPGTVQAGVGRNGHRTARHRIRVAPTADSPCRGAVVVR